MVLSLDSCPAPLIIGDGRTYKVYMPNSSAGFGNVGLSLMFVKHARSPRGAYSHRRFGFRRSFSSYRRPFRIPYRRNYKSSYHSRFRRFRRY